MHRADQIDADGANLARIDVGILLLGVADQARSGLLFSSLDVGYDLGIGGKNIPAEGNQFIVTDNRNAH